ncbi:MAG: acylphosphatase [Candidatus Methanoperedens sp.]|nr:acylphosphatase [Candidatus Methanoperedens sp.]
MALKRATIFVSGNVQMVNFRGFVKKLADSLEIKGYADNLPDGRVQIVCEGEEKGIEELINSIKNKAPSLSKVEDLQTEYGDYAGEFVDFERRGEDVPKKATLDDLLKVMISFDNKAEKMVRVLGGIKDNTEKILDHTSHIPRIVENTSLIPAMREDIAEMKSHTSIIPAMREDTHAIRTDTKEIATKLWEKYEELSREIAQMKITLSKIEAKVFS